MNLGEAILSRKVVRVKVQTPKKPRVYSKPVGYKHPTPTIDKVVAALGDRSTTRDIATAIGVELSVAFVHLHRAEKAGRAERWKEGRLTYWRVIK